MAAGRRRLALVAVVGVIVVVLLVVLLGGGGSGAVNPPAPAKPLAGSAHGSGADVVPPPGDQFCAQGEQGCKP